MVLFDANRLWSIRNPSSHSQQGRQRLDSVMLAPPGTEPHGTQSQLSRAGWGALLTARLFSSKGFLQVPSARQDGALWGSHW